MLHTKWNSIDKYSYSSHVTYTGAFSIVAIPFKTGNRDEQRIRQTLLDFGYCCRIYPILELEEPSMLQHSKWSGEWLKPEYSEALSFHLLAPGSYLLFVNCYRDHICHKHHKQRLCKLIITRVKVPFVDVF